MGLILNTATILGGVAAVGYFIDKYTDIRERKPTAALMYKGESPPVLVVTVYNTNHRIPLHIHSVRIYFGQKDYCHALVLAPETTLTIQPKAKASYTLPYEKNIVERRVTQRSLHCTDIPPSFDSPANLFMAIANGPKDASWLGIQYNEDKHADLLRGKVKQAFQTMLEIGRKANHRQRSKQMEVIADPPAASAPPSS